MNAYTTGPAWPGVLFPLQAAERSFADTASHLRLDPDAAGGVLLAEHAVDAAELRSWLLKATTSPAARDAVWRVVIARARADEQWMVGAIGLAMPGLRAAARRACRGLGAEAACDVEAEVLAGFTAAVGEVNPEWSRLAWRLRCRAQRAGMRARHREARQPVLPGRLPESSAPRCPWGHPDLVLADAVAAGVITVGEAQLIAESRLENTTLAKIAAELGVAYQTLHKRRSRAEARLVEAITSGRLSSLFFTRTAEPAPIEAA